MQKHNKQQYQIIKRIYRKIKIHYFHKQKEIYKTYICDKTTNKQKHKIKQKCRKRSYDLFVKIKKHKIILDFLIQIII